MATATAVSIAEYLQTSYRPDREYIDGEVRERNVGKWEHARLQWLIANWFGRYEDEWNIIGSTEQRTRVSGSRVRIPDLVLLHAQAQPDVLIAPPLLIIEILSPDDSYSDLEERVADYLHMGVQSIWVIDPKTRTGRMCSAAGWMTATRLGIVGTPIYMELATLFASLDRYGRTSS